MNLVCLDVELEGTTAMSFSKTTTSPKEQGETPDTYESRTWRERIHTDAAGMVTIPGNMVKRTLWETAKYLGESVPGKGKATYTKHFLAGVIVADDAPLGIAAKDVKGERLFVPADGKPGGGKRVWKIFPLIPAGWRAKFRLYLVDPVLADKPDKVKSYLEYAGRLIGFGRWRLRVGGCYGKFKVVSAKIGSASV